MTDPHSEPYETGNLDIDQGLSVSAPPQRQPRRGTRQAQSRDLPREPSRTDVVVKGRNGEILTRKRVAGIDPFHIDPAIIPPGWDYQWNTVTVYNNKDITVAQTMAMYENGWRPVPAERHPGKFVPVGVKGEIIRDGQRLEERPMSMTEEARAEDIATARRLISDRNESLKLAGMKTAMPEGLEMSRRYRGTGGDIRMSIDPALDAPVAQHTLAEPGE